MIQCIRNFLFSIESPTREEISLNHTREKISIKTPMWERFYWIARKPNKRELISIEIHTRERKIPWKATQKKENIHEKQHRTKKISIPSHSGQRNFHEKRQRREKIPMKSDIGKWKFTTQLQTFCATRGNFCNTSTLKKISDEKFSCQAIISIPSNTMPRHKNQHIQQDRVK